MTEAPELEIPPRLNDGDTRTDTAPIEAIMFKAQMLNARVIGLAAPTTGLGLPQLARSLAKCLAAAGRKPVLLDLSGENAALSETARWRPNEPIASSNLVTDVDGFDRLTANPDAKARALFNNTEHLRNMLSNDLGDYSHVIVQLSPLLEAQPNLPNPVAVARGCDAIFLLAVAGLTTSPQTSRSVALLKSVDAPLAGAIIDESDVRSPGEEMAQLVAKIPFVPGSIKRQIGETLRASSILNP